jgi:hypothetical protein
MSLQTSTCPSSFSDPSSSVSSSCCLSSPELSKDSIELSTFLYDFLNCFEPGFRKNINLWNILKSDEIIQNFKEGQICFSIVPDSTFMRWSSEGATGIFKTIEQKFPKASGEDEKTKIQKFKYSEAGVYFYVTLVDRVIHKGKEYLVDSCGKKTLKRNIRMVKFFIYHFSSPKNFTRFHSADKLIQPPQNPSEQDDGKLGDAATDAFAFK